MSDHYKEYPPEFFKQLDSVTGKRARIVVEHILEHGQITTEELQRDYGYEHPPRAARDVREQGIPLKTIRVRSSDGRRIAAYRFGDPEEVDRGKLGGRKVFSKEFVRRLYSEHDRRCAICLEDYELRYLQIDHRVPYEVAGDDPHDRNVNDYMLLCGSDNRAKSWSCENCENWRNIKNPEICTECYWAFPQSYSHIAMRPIRRLDLVWSSALEVNVYDRLRMMAEEASEPLQEYIKEVLRFYLEEDD